MLYTVHSSSNRLGRSSCYDTQEHHRRNTRALLDGHYQLARFRLQVIVTPTSTQTNDLPSPQSTSGSAANTTCYCTLDFHDNSYTFFFCFCYILLALAAAASALLPLIYSRCGQGIHEDFCQWQSNGDCWAKLSQKCP